MNTCFYSARCKYSQAFLEELARTPYSKEFKFVCVDGSPRPVLPAYVKAVPTLMIAGEPEPRVDGSVMNWLSERRLGEVQTSNPGGFDAGLSSAGVVGPSAFINSEIFGGSDEGYAFIGEDTNATSGATERLTGNMASFDDMASMMISDARASGQLGKMKSAPAIQATPKTTGKSKALDDAYTAFQAARNRDFPGSQRK